MRILHLGYTHTQNPWNAGGAAAAARQVYARLSDRHQITVFCGGWRAGPSSEEMGGVEYVFGPRARSYVGSRMGYSWTARHMAAQGRFDLIVDDMSAYSPSFAWRHAGCPTVALIQLDLLRATRKYPLIGAVARRWVLEALGSYSNFVCVSPSLMQDTAPLSQPDRRATFIPNGVSADLLDLAGEEEPYILFLGRLDTYAKGLDVLVSELPGVLSRHPDVRLIVAGSGPDGPALQRRVHATPALAENVEFVGRVSGQAKTDLLRKCLCVVMPSRHEGWPLVAMEAGACGKAVVGSTAPGLSDAVVHGETGILVDTSKPGALPEALARVIADRRLRHSLGEAGRERARAFTWEALAPRYEQFYESVACGAPKEGGCP